MNALIVENMSTVLNIFSIINPIKKGGILIKTINANKNMYSSKLVNKGIPNIEFKVSELGFIILVIYAIIAKRKSLLLNFNPILLLMRIFVNRIIMINSNGVKNAL